MDAVLQTTAGIAILALTAIPEIYAAVEPSGVAEADVCASAGRRVSISGCTNIADTVNSFAPPAGRLRPVAAGLSAAAPATATTATSRRLCRRRPANPCEYVFLIERVRAWVAGGRDFGPLTG